MLIFLSIVDEVALLWRGIYKGQGFQTHMYKGTVLTAKDILL